MLKSKSFISKEISVNVVIDTYELKAYVHYMYCTAVNSKMNSEDACNAFDDLEEEIQDFCDEHDAYLWSY